MLQGLPDFKCSILQRCPKRDVSFLIRSPNENKVSACVYLNHAFSLGAILPPVGKKWSWEAKISPIGQCSVLLNKITFFSVYLTGEKFNFNSFTDLSLIFYEEWVNNEKKIEKQWSKWKCFSNTLLLWPSTSTSIISPRERVPERGRNTKLLTASSFLIVQNLNVHWLEMVESTLVNLYYKTLDSSKERGKSRHRERNWQGEPPHHITGERKQSVEYVCTIIFILN